MNIRNKRQEEFADVWIKRGKFGILNLCPRFGTNKVSYTNFLKTML
jgi:hypothetical protein